MLLRLFNSTIILDLSGLRQIPALFFWFIIASLGLCVLFYFYRSYRALLSARVIEDMPTAKIRSAAQGLVEFQGKPRYYQGKPIYAPLSLLPCTWYQYTIEQYVQKKWTLIDKGASQHRFELDDGTGICVIDPKGALVKFDQMDVWYGFSRTPKGKPKTWFGRLWSSLGKFRYKEKRMTPEMDLYAMGNFTTEQTPDGQEIHILNGANASSDRPFLLSVIPPSKMTQQYKISAFFWFVAYLCLLILIASIIFVRIYGA
jgi:hypothetical protein